MVPKLPGIDVFRCCYAILGRRIPSMVKGHVTSRCVQGLLQVGLNIPIAVNVVNSDAPSGKWGVEKFNCWPERF